MQRVSVAARVGLAGNPSDAYGGAAVAVPVPSLTATVEVDGGDFLRITGPTDGGRLVGTAVARLARYAGRNEGLEVRWSTTIPREVGLAGSSAIVIATLRAVAARWSVVIEPLDLAHMALAVEVDDLGIAAGMMDRAVQAFGAPVLVDGDDARPLQVERLPTLGLAWSLAAAGPSDQVHGPLRARFDAGEPGVVDAMARLAALGRDGAAALEAGDVDALRRAVRATFAERVGLGIVGPEMVAMAEALEAIGGAATSAGSGGAVVAVLPEGLSSAEVDAALGGRADGVLVLTP
jgi:glucuronokinase